MADASGNVLASYSYDEYGIPLSSSKSFPGGWTNPYRYDGRDRVRYDAETGLYWMSIRAYDSTLGRFLARDPLGRVPLMGWTNQPYAYAGNNPLVNVDPSGQRLVGANGAVVESAPQWHANNRTTYHAEARRPYQAPSAHVANRNNVTGFFSAIEDVVTSVGAIIGMALIGSVVASDGLLLLDPGWWGAAFGGGSGIASLVKILHDQESKQLSEYNWVPPMSMVSCSGDPGAWAYNMA